MDNIKKWTILNSLMMNVERKSAKIDSYTDSRNNDKKAGYMVMLNLLIIQSLLGKKCMYRNALPPGFVLKLKLKGKSNNRSILKSS
ncbi:hypothetical protein RhiirA5_350150 [Rhizophagus irregularis]|uniref:Uncharacterized protein n=3 Tax=Rhizophagus irregularis TaxID=588596 RepID=U9UTX2_RHIID|nr:hypothetical protein GLOIN_2v1589720 [Rhizophagus irregularis DAOM 181602=DAOM 197198]PKC14584.1 hypothetical protein RhiirA5_350150 [Rhizophagus irregularis]PKK73725.1 hypothetical protein RhiirC2_740213 [Rhizophagus irregularis]POG73149.1 hypothetical protein GLOIN_2v1589720 [Rhizophagus irregularis DAOM 181602=DAOM 197198]|eukprot:XP_025180015.1 hypothetical protein GLOIN_2v1589720 [Rhizophagus irregularis DAOM 181602=DAOM 197198]